MARIGNIHHFQTNPHEFYLTPTLGMMIQSDSYFSRWLKPPTRCLGIINVLFWDVWMCQKDSKRGWTSASIPAILLLSRVTWVFDLSSTIPYYTKTGYLYHFSVKQSTIPTYTNYFPRLLINKFHSTSSLVHVKTCQKTAGNRTQRAVVNFGFLRKAGYTLMVCHVRIKVSDLLGTYFKYPLVN